MRPQERDLIIRKNLAEVFTKASHGQLQTLFHELRESYGGPHRVYHTLDHVADMLKEAENFPLHDPKAFKAAILFHDAVYNPAQDKSVLSNEEQSARLCEITLARHGIRNGTAARATSLIRMTETHDVPEGDYEAALFMDIDMSILGATPERYNRYARGIAREFIPSVGADKYCAGRTQFLERIANGESHVFKTQDFAHLNKAAQDNAAHEIASLSSIIERAMPSAAI